jgi:hypothetical protein
MDCLLTDVLRWDPTTVPEGYVLMLIKSCLNLQQASQVCDLVNRCEANLTASTIFAYIEMLQLYKLNDQVPAVIELLL